MNLNAYLVFPGTCETAFKFYEQCLGGSLEMMTHRNTPVASQVPADWLDKIVHARLVIDGNVLMGSDGPPGHSAKPAGFSVNISVKEPGEAERIFKSMSQNATVHMAMQETFWAQRFAMFTDQFGTPWMINCEKPR